MATTITVTNSDRFVEGETVDAFLIVGSQRNAQSGAASAANAAVTAGVLALTGLAEGRNYQLKGRTSGGTTHVRTDTAVADIPPPPSWRARRTALGLS